MKKQIKKQNKTAGQKKPGFFETLLGPDPRYDDYYEEEESELVSSVPDDEQTKKNENPANSKYRKNKKSEQPKVKKRVSQLKRMKVKYFFSVIAIYILTFFALYGIASVFLIIWPVHPYLNMIIVIVVAALTVALSSHIANNTLQNRWLHHQD
ncbi:MAG: hypothetical protein EOM64_09300 [Erysipelotrichia bacterium]|nr:hypothetical protein [Erysipelotrichia bacterium]